MPHLPLSRRRVLMMSVASVALAACVPTSKTTPSAAPENPASRPNIIVILADDLGWSDLGCYGGEVRTPNLDRLAAHGLRFTRAYNTSKCYTSRASLLTGVYQHEAGIGGVISRADRPMTTGPYQGYLDPDVPTLPEQLRAAGYRSYHSGKWHVGEREQHWPLKRGFDRSFALISGATSYYEVLQEEGRQRVMTLDDEIWTPPADGFYATDAYSNAALGYLRDHELAHDGKPFFLYLAYTAPHWPLHAPEARIAPYLPVYLKGWDTIRSERIARQAANGLTTRQSAPAARPDDVPPFALVEEKEIWARRMATYAAMIEIMDEGVGRIIAQLEASDQLDNTLILFLSDNGASHEDISARGLDLPGSVIGDRESFQNIRAPWAWAANAPFRGSKESVFEGGINTPLIAHWPRGIPSPGLRKAVCHVVDIVPTALSVAGLWPLAERQHAPALRGIDLTGVFSGAEPDRGDLFFEIFGNRALIDGAWKALAHKGDTDWSLFDLDADPGEQTNLATLQSGRLADMKARWKQTAQEIGVRGI